MSASLAGERVALEGSDSGKVFWAEGWKMSLDSMLSASLIGQGERRRKCLPLQPC